MASEVKEANNFINLGVILNDKGEVLMIRRVREETGSSGAVLRWAFPGGKQRLDETREVCVRREVLAETGYDVKPIQQISLRIHPQFKIFIVYHRCELNAPEPVAEPAEPHEVAEVKWIKPADIEKLITTDLDPNVRKTLGLKIAPVANVGSS